MNTADSTHQRCVSDYSFGKFKMKPGEVILTWHDKEDDKHNRMVLTHRSTGVQIFGYIKPGYNPSKKEISEMRKHFIKKNLSLLESMTRRHLRACMASQYGPIPKGQFDE